MNLFHPTAERFSIKKEIEINSAVEIERKRERERERERKKEREREKIVTKFWCQVRALSMRLIATHSNSSQRPN